MNPNHLEATHERWERGFLVECTVRLEGNAVDLPEWGTIKTLHVFERPELPAELASPHLRSLRAVRLYGSEAFATRARTTLARVANRVMRVRHVERPVDAIWLR